MSNDSNKMALRYQHQPLQSTHSFRVLKLYPSPAGEPLSCDIREVSLHHPPRYEALSYTWGSPNPVHNLYCNGRQLPITPNCATALERLRDRRKAGIFWVDSICIDQSSIPERNQQVKLMMDIYSSASRVVVYLGESTQDSDIAMQILCRLTPKSGITKIFHRLSEKAPKETAILKDIQRVNQARFGVNLSSKSSVMDDIFERPWFERMWTIQEVAMAKRATIHCGGGRISWDHFAEAIRLLVQSDSSNSLNLLRRLKIFDLHELLRQMLKSLDREPTQLLRARWSLNMASICGRKSTDPKDKVYALYGVFQALGIRPPDPDYTKTVTQVYQETARSMIEAQDSLDMLYLASGSISNLERLPSWTPDWTYESYQVPMIVSNRIPRRYKAAGISQAIFRFSEDSSQCFVIGHVLDEVAVCGEVPPNPPLGLGSNSLWCMYHTVVTLKRWIRLAMTQNTGIEPSLLLFDILSELGAPGSSIKDKGLYDQWMSILMDTASCCNNINPSWYKARFIDAVRRNWIMHPDLDMEIDYFAQTPESEALCHFEKHLELSNFHLSAGAYALESQFLITLGGRFAKGPPSVRVGDIIVLISGVELPMFLRPVEDGFIVIGPGYMPGVMYGEEWPETRVELMQFILV